MERLYHEKFTVLIVDDEQNSRKALTSLLTKCGYRVESVSNGHKGIEIVKEQDIALVILDIKMPDIDGIETLKMMRAIKSDLQAIFITAYPQDERTEKFISSSQCPLFEKPIDLNGLKQCIEQILTEEKCNKNKKAGKEV